MCFIETERLIIRRFVPGDWRDLYEYLSREEVVEFEPYGVYNQADCRKEADRRAADERFKAVCLKPDAQKQARPSHASKPDGYTPEYPESAHRPQACGKLIGNIYLSAPEDGTCELGYVFNDAFQGMGYATEAARAVVGDAFANLGARRIVAMCNPLNVSSWKLLERLGMRREGWLLQNVSFKTDAAGRPVWQDTFEYAILASEYFYRAPD